METVEDIKRARLASSTTMTMKLAEVFDAIQGLEESDQEIYVNGESKDLKDHCTVAKSKLKPKKCKEK
jgi:hypothetical protein